MKHISPIICTVLAVIMLFTVPVSAMENTDSRASNFFGSSDVYLYRISSTTFQAWFEVCAFYTMDKLGASEIKIQKSSDNENWTTVKTCTMANYSNLICENTGAHASYVSYTGTSGYYYRARITLYAKDGTASGEVTRYTASILL